jgi:hypothetical protein
MNQDPWNRPRWSDEQMFTARLRAFESQAAYDAKHGDGQKDPRPWPTEKARKELGKQEASG